MRIPVVRGLIDRRILVNFRVEPGVLAGLLPAPFRPKLVNGVGIAGICLIRLKHVRPRFLPGFVGVSSENAAHRIAVEWDADGATRHGVYIPRRDTSSRFNALVGGRLFPGIHHHAGFHVDERDGRYRLAIDADDGSMHVAVEGRACDELPASSVFRDLGEASEFFRCGSLGYSPDARGNSCEGLELRTFGWNMAPLAVESVESSYFEDRELFPAGSVEFDSALLMRGIEHEWHVASGIAATDCRTSDAPACEKRETSGVGR